MTDSRRPVSVRPRRWRGVLITQGSERRKAQDDRMWLKRSETYGAIVEWTESVRKLLVENHGSGTVPELTPQRIGAMRLYGSPQANEALRLVRRLLPGAIQALNE
jgi:hypothetical protein